MSHESDIATLLYDVAWPETVESHSQLHPAPDTVTPGPRHGVWHGARRMSQSFSEKFIWSFWQYVRGLAFWIQNIYFRRRKKIFELLNISW